MCRYAYVLVLKVYQTLLTYEQLSIVFVLQDKFNSLIFQISTFNINVRLRQCPLCLFFLLTQPYYNIQLLLCILNLCLRRTLFSLLLHTTQLLQLIAQLLPLFLMGLSEFIKKFLQLLQLRFEPFLVFPVLIHKFLDISSSLEAVRLLIAINPCSHVF